jgi:hypothetical protein
MNVLTTEHALARSAWENVNWLRRRANWLRRRVEVVHAGLTLSYELLTAISGLVEAGRSNLCANGRRGPMPIRSHAYLVSAATPSQLAHTTKGHFSPGQHRGDNADRAPVQVLPESAEEYPPNGGRCRPSFDGASEVHPLTQVVRSPAWEIWPRRRRAKNTARLVWADNGTKARGRDIPKRNFAPPALYLRLRGAMLG